jgi:phage gp29-like protein
MTFTERLTAIFKRSKKTDAAPVPAPEPVSPFDKIPERIPQRRSERDLPVSADYAWNLVSSVRAALTDLDRGNFGLPAMMLDAMLGDSHITAKLEDRLVGVFGAPFDMTPPPGLEEDKTALEIAKDALEMWSSVGADQGDRLVLRDGIMLGAGLGEVVVEPGESDWRIRLRHWHARNLSWRWDTRSYWVQTIGGPEELRPDGRGGFYSAWKENGRERIARWFLFTPYGYQRGWVNARVKAVSIPWLLRTWAFRDWGRHSEMLGIPPRKMKIPAEWDAEEKKRAIREVTAMASESIIRCPQREDGTGFDVELLELKGPNGWEAFDKLIAKAEAAITVALVGQTLTTQVDAKGGNRALGEVHERVASQLRKADAVGFGAAARASICIPWTEFNFGSPDLAPTPTWAVDPPEDLKTLGEGMKAVGEGFTALHAAGVPVDRAKVCADAGLPMEDGAEFEEIETPEPAEPAAGGSSGEDDGEEGPTARMTALARAALPAGARRGQRYVDDLAYHGTRQARLDLGQDVLDLLQVVRQTPAGADGKPDQEKLRAALLERFKGMSVKTLAETVRRCGVLAEMNGRVSVLEDV